MVTEKYQPGDMLGLFEHTLGDRGLDRRQQDELLAMCEEKNEAQDLFYFIFIKKGIALREINFSVREAVGKAFIFRCNREREDLRLKEETRKVVFQPPALELARAV